MKHRHSFIFLAAAALVLLFACELAPELTFDDIKGEWDFPDGTHLSVMGTASAPMWDYGFKDATKNYWTWIHSGSFSGTTFTGTYGYNATFIEGGADAGSGLNIPMSAVFSLADGRLRVVFTTAEGPYKDKIIEKGTRSAPLPM